MWKNYPSGIVHKVTNNMLNINNYTINYDVKSFNWSESKYYRKWCYIDEVDYDIYKLQHVEENKTNQHDFLVYYEGHIRLSFVILK